MVVSAACRPLHKGGRIQLVGKGLGSFKCSRCNTRSVQVSRRPIYQEFLAAFRGVDKEEAQEFYRTIGAATPQDLDKIMQDHISRRQRHRQRDARLGKYLPLGVYAAQGFDIKRIEDEITDTMDLPGLGKCYRVPIPEVGDIMDSEGQHSHPRPLGPERMHSTTKGGNTISATATKSTSTIDLQQHDR